MKYKEVRIYGAGGHSKVLKNLLSLIGCTVRKTFDDSKRPDIIFDKIDQGGDKDNFLDFPHTGLPFIIAIGDNKKRYQLSKVIKSAFATAVHPSATVAPDIEIKEGSVVFAGAVIQPNTRIGKHVIINTAASVDHDNIIGDFVHISPNVTLCGGVEIKEGTIVGSAAVVIPNITIGKWCTIGAGAVIIKDIPDYCTVVGNPGKIIKQKIIEQKTLFSANEVKNENAEDSLEVLDLSLTKDLKEYKNLNGNVFNFNPYYSVEYMSHYQFSMDKLLVLVLRKNNQALGFLPIFLRKINTPINDKTYYDIISPYGYSGPYFNAKAPPSEYSEFWKKVDSWYKENKIVSEFIRFNLDNNQIGYTGVLNAALKNVRGVILQDFDEQWASFSPKVRRNYRKAINSKLTFSIHNASEIKDPSIKKFHDIYIQTMERNSASKKYFYSLDYFRKLILSSTENYFLAFVYHQEIAISAELIIKNKDSIFGFMGGTLSDYFLFRPNDFLRVEVIKWAMANNVPYYIMGGGRADGDSLYQYKKSFFPKDKDQIFYTGKKIIDDSIYSQLNEIAKEKYKGSVSEKNPAYFPSYRKYG